MKRSQLDKAIEAIENEIAVLMLARDRLQAQKDGAPKRKPRKSQQPILAEVK